MIFFCFHEESWDFSWWILQTPWNYGASDDLSHLGVQKRKYHRPIYPREKPLKLKYRDGSICHPIRNVCLDLKNRCLVCEPATLPINKKEKKKKEKRGRRVFNMSCTQTSSDTTVRSLGGEGKRWVRRYRDRAMMTKTTRKKELLWAVNSGCKKTRTHIYPEGVMWAQMLDETVSLCCLFCWYVSGLKLLLLCHKIKRSIGTSCRMQSQ